MTHPWIRTAGKIVRETDPINLIGRTHQIITLTEGRSLGYAEYGDLQGRPVFLFHGQPGNRLFRYPGDARTAEIGIRLITVDRPGYGLSDYQPGRRLLDWPQDVAELADSLGFDRFAVLGFSAGGPYALACAYQIPGRLTKVGLADSAPPMDLPEINVIAPVPLRINYLLARYTPLILRLIFAAYWRTSQRNPDAFIQMAIKQACPADREILNRPDIYAMLVEVWKENIRVDSQGYVKDAGILMSPWGFRLRDIAAEVLLWQGEADTNTPVAWARFLAREIPNCSASYLPNEGHFALFAHWEEILRTLVNP